MCFCHRAILWLRTTAVACLSTTLCAQSFAYADFADTSQLALLGNASVVGNVLRLTANAPNQSGWAWRQAPVTVAYGFSTTFTFRLLPSAFGTKGEGLAFVVHDSAQGASATGGTAWGLGYGVGASGSIGLRSSIVVEIDTYQDYLLNDTSDNELSVHIPSPIFPGPEHESRSIGNTTPTTVMSDGVVHTLRIECQSGLIEVFLDGVAQPTLSTDYDQLTGGEYLTGQPAPPFNPSSGTAFVGFCATTGAGTLTELAEVLSWTWSSSLPPHPCYQGTLSEDVLTIEGQTGGISRTVKLGTWQSFDIGIAATSGYGPGSPYVLLLSLLPQPGVLGTQLGFGEMCFPVFPLGANELVLADTFGFVPALLPAAPTPHTIQLPSGLVIAPFHFTLQAITFASASPLILGTSNAIDVQFRPAPPLTLQLLTPFSAAVGAAITLNGEGFLPGLLLDIDGVLTPISSVTPSQVVFAYPAGVACDATLTITNPDGQSVASAINPQITVSSTSPASGPTVGNTPVFVYGSGLIQGTTVTIAGIPATILVALADRLLIRTPPGMQGVQPLVVTSPGGCTATTTFTYL